MGRSEEQNRTKTNHCVRVVENKVGVKEINMSSSASNGNSGDQLSRLCHVIKRDDFDGYGFNLHAEKGKPGQYIGKVDDNSPAETSGLRQGDRIIEVNGVNIGTETHKQVVQRIKAIACEVRLLVVDPNVVSVSNENFIVATSNGNGVESSDSTNLSDTTHNNGASMNHSPIDKRDSSLPPPPPPSVTMAGNNGNVTTGGRDNVDTKLHGNGFDASNNATSQIISKSPSKLVATSTSSTASSGGATTTDEGLNLKMTAAELRAKLAAKKKYDPKTDTVDLRKKYEIVQKL